MRSGPVRDRMAFRRSPGAARCAGALHRFSGRSAMSREPLMPPASPENADALRRAGTRLQTLLEVSRQLARAGDPRHVIAGVCHAVRELVGAQHALLAVGDAATGHASEWTSSGIDAATVASMGVPVLHLAFAGETLRTREPACASNRGGDPAAVGFPAGHPPVHAWMAAPIVSGQRAYGWIVVSNKMKEMKAAHFSDDDQILLELLCSQLGRAFDHHRLVAADSPERTRFPGRDSEHRKEMAQARAPEKIALERELLKAIEAGQFVLHYQPKVELSTGQIIGSEALLRWQHPQRGLLMPGQFLAVAEDSDVILDIGEWVLRAGCTQTANWHDAGLPAISLSVNLSARQFRDDALQQRVADVLRDTGLRPPSLELELTEKIVMHDAAHFVERLDALKVLGVKLSLDDFGTGYSNLSYLKRFPLDRLKVDQSFIRDVTSSPDDAAIVRAVISLGHSLGLDIVAEGVETEAQVEWLRRERCEQIQGYVFSRPVPAAQFELLLRSRKGLPSRAATAPGEAKTLLIVDDEPAILASLVRLLRRDGYRILTAQSAKEALDLLALNVVQVIISDHRMPVITGAEFFGKVKTLYPDTVRILFSGYIEIDALTEAVNRGAVYRFLLKPWDDETLRESIRQAFHHYWLTHKDLDPLQPASGT